MDPQVDSLRVAGADLHHEADGPAHPLLVGLVWDEDHGDRAVDPSERTQVAALRGQHDDPGQGVEVRASGHRRQAVGGQSPINQDQDTTGHPVQGRTD